MANLRKTVYEHIHSGSDKFLDLMVDLAERAVDGVDDDMDIDQAVNDAIDIGMIYTDDQWEAYRHYCDIGDDQNIMWEGLWNDLYSIVFDLIEEDTEDEEEE